MFLQGARGSKDIEAYFYAMCADLVKKISGYRLEQTSFLP
jgi:hypothetical protein